MTEKQPQITQISQIARKDILKRVDLEDGRICIITKAGRKHFFESAKSAKSAVKEVSDVQDQR